MPIGYYVHHQGHGHRARALAIARAAPGQFTLAGTGLAGATGEVPALDLAGDLPDDTTMFDDASPRLHYAPLRHAGVRARMAALAGWMEAARPALLVCDVSVEVAMLARLLATQTVYVRLNGERTDSAHLAAFGAAKALLAPFHPALEDERTPLWVREKTTYAPGITPAPATAAPVPGRILVVSGAGGAPFDGDDIAAAARATPGHRWRAIGPVTPAAWPCNVTAPGWVEDVAAEIAQACLVIGAGGDGLVSAVIAAARPFICLPQPRPYGEQAATAAGLHACGAAIVLPAWPPAAAWPALIARAAALDVARVAALHDPAGARKAADFLMAAAG